MASDMPQRFVVTPLQVRAAKVALKASAKLGRQPEPALVRIANARPAVGRSHT